MPKIFFIVLIIKHAVLSLNPRLFQSPLCIISTEELSMILQKHFHFTHHITITVLHSSTYFMEMNSFANELIKLLMFDANGKYKFLYKIQERNCSNCSRTEINLCNYKFDLNRKNKTNIRDDEMMKMKQQTTEFGIGYLIITWNIEIFEKFMILYGNESVQKTRASLAIISMLNNCTTENQAHSLLKNLWFDFKILNAIFLSFCFCKPKIYIYKPFIKTQGITEDYNFMDFVNNPEVITNSIKNMHSFPLNISLFNAIPTSVKTISKLLKANSIYRNMNNFAGSDGLLVKTLAEYLNFEPVFDPNLRELSYGHVNPDGSFDGVFADIVRKKSDYGANRRFMVYYTVNEFEFLVPYSSDKIIVAVPKSLKIQHGESWIKCFDLLSWLGILSVIVVCIFLWYCLRIFQNFIKCFREIVSYLLGIPYFLKPSFEQMLFLISCMMFQIIIFGIIQGSLYTDFTTVRYYPEIETLEQVYRSNLPILAFAWLIISDNKSTIIKKLKQQSIFYEGVDMLDLVAYNRNVSAIVRKFDAEFDVKTKFSDKNGIPLLHIVEESIVSLMVTSIVPKNSPFLIVFNQVITRMFEGGFIEKWDNDVVSTMVLEHFKQMLTPEDVQAFSLNDMEIAFFIIGIGYFCSIVIFIWEVLWKRFIFNK